MGTVNARGNQRDIRARPAPGRSRIDERGLDERASLSIISA